MKSEKSVSRREFLQTGAALGVAATALRESVAQETEWAQSSEQRVRIGVVGGRFGLSWHWHEHPNCVVEAVSDLIPERRTQLMAKYSYEKSYESLEKLILDPKIDAVALFTPAPDQFLAAEMPA